MKSYRVSIRVAFHKQTNVINVEMKELAVRCIIFDEISSDVS